MKNDTFPDKHLPETRPLLMPDSEHCLDTIQLQSLEESFREWVQSCKRADIRTSRKRILVIFLIIRYTGAKLNEVLNFDLLQDFDHSRNTVRFWKRQDKMEPVYREVQVPETISCELNEFSSAWETKGAQGPIFRIDPAHVRRKFYERAEAIGIQSAMGAPEVIRKSRAVELIRSNMPLQVVQKILGHSTPNLAASYVEFSDNEIYKVAKYYADRENNRKTSARNSFFGKINAIGKGEIQSLIEVISVSGKTITAIITNGSLTRLGLKPGMLITAEVKAPMIQLSPAPNEPRCSAENMFQGTVHRITGNHTTAEVVVQLADGTELCAIISDKRRRHLAIKHQDRLWAYFDAFAVVLRVD
jgi:molybdate transport system regulatory protein